MIVYKPEEITSAKLIASTLFETAPSAFDVGTTYALDAYVAVAGALGRIDIYKSLQAGNTGNAPAVSPAWWAWSSFVYQPFQQGGGYDLDFVVYDPATRKNYKSIAEYNNGVLDPVSNPPWLQVGTNTSTLPAAWSAATTYSIGDRVLLTLAMTPGTAIFGDPSDVVIYQKIWVSNINGNLNLEPDPYPPYLPPGPWTEDKTHPVPWVKTVSYAAGRVVYTTDGKLWKTSTGCKGITPADSYKATWVGVGAANYWAAFDAESSSQSIGAQKMEFTVAPGVVDAVILINAEADLVEITVREGLGGAIIHQASSGVLGNSITDWWEYFHSDLFIDRRQVRFDGLPLSANAHITVTLTGATLALGDLIFSRGREIGLTGWGLQVGIKDFSVIKEDENFGATTFVKRRNRKRMESREWIKKDQFNRTFSLLSDLTATPCVWVAGDVEELNEALMLKAWYRDFTTEINGKYELYTSLKLEGMT